MRSLCTAGVYSSREGTGRPGNAVLCFILLSVSMLIVDILFSSLFRVHSRQMSNLRKSTLWEYRLF